VTLLTSTAVCDRVRPKVLWCHTPAMKMTRVNVEWVLAGLAVLFLAAYAWPILDPQLGQPSRTTCSVVIVAVWVAFGIDYLVRLALAQNRSRWFFHHLLDLIVLVVPIFRPLRLLRLITLVRVLNRSTASSFRGRVGMYVGSGSALLAVVAALAALDAERHSPDANISTFGDALWWACTTMTTVGYGDRYPVTGTGRVVGVGLMVAGIGLLGTVTATLAAWLVESVAAGTVDALEAIEDSAQDTGADLVAELERLRHEVSAVVAKLNAFEPPVESRAVSAED
jgi:voltage-gated potassium channel